MCFASFVFGLVTVMGIGSAGCALQYDKPHEGRANGAAGTLYFADVSAANAGTVPIGGTRTIKVARYSPGILKCAKFPASPEESNVGLRGGPSIPPDRCTGLRPDAVELVSASCPDDACAVTSSIEDDVIVLRVSAKEARATKLEVILKKAETGESFTDSVAIAFAKAGRIALRGASEIGVPLVVGAEVYLPDGRLLDEKGNEMSIDDGALVRTQSGDAIAPPEHEMGSAKALTAGKTKLVWEIAGVMRREASIEVVAPSEVARLEAFADAKTDVALDDETTKPAWLGAAPLARVDASSREQTTVIVAARLKDERLALVGLTSGELRPEVLGSIQAYPNGSFVVFPASPPVAGEGTVNVRAGNLEGRFEIVMH